MLKPKFLKIRSNEQGATILEYSMVLVGVALVCYLALSVIGTETRDSFDPVTSVLP